MSEKWKQKTLLIFPFAVLAVGMILTAAFFLHTYQQIAFEHTSAWDGSSFRSPRWTEQPSSFSRWSVRSSAQNREAGTSRPYPSGRWCSCASPNPARCPPGQSGGSAVWRPAAAGHGRTPSGSCRWCWRAGLSP